ncbi:hypothetical protein [Altererythrobacter sp. ZODW24]|uniref:hypothetical protein n=1 Tax=Altererythrobacter sp. ZODW24 TaxID=2185142 RepID=UPI000DF83784|nr:hypothetical protein [Altererythrobacter sp. ZODW24]
MEDTIEFFIVAAPFIGGIGLIWYAVRKKIKNLRTELSAQSTNSTAQQFAAEKSEMEERIRVLERIVTDRGYDVATQIEALRDAPDAQRLLDQRKATDSGTPLNFEMKEQA